MPARLVIGTRGSALALCQARWVARRLERSGSPVEVLVIRTTGDRMGEVPLATLGPGQGLKGVFTKEIEEALLEGAIDLAVHSLKDLPTELDPRLELACVPERADPRDALVGRTLQALAPGDRVGTGSPRRAAQLRALLPEIRILEIRGNVDTRIRKLREGRYDAIMLAAAGLQRLGLAGEADELLDPGQIVPAIGQGALGIETRAGDGRVRRALAPLHEPLAAAEVEAERALLRSLGGGCEAPLGAHARVRKGMLRLRAAAALPSGAIVRAGGRAPLAEAAALGARVARELRGSGVFPDARVA